MHLNVVDIQLDAMPLLNDCRQLISQIAQVRIRHCFREANSCADFLARIGAYHDRTFVLHHDPLVDLLELLRSNKTGLYHNISSLSPLTLFR